MKIFDPDFDYENGVLKNILGITTNSELKQAESDFAIVRIKEILESSDYYPSPSYLKSLHKRIFGDVYPFAGNYRKVQIYKQERALAYLSVDYESPEKVSTTLEEIFSKEREIDFTTLTKEEKIDHVTHLIVDIWKCHPFREGNTRTILVFLREYLKYYGILFDPELFKDGKVFTYARDALVAASFEASDLNVSRNYEYLRVLISDIISSSLNKGEMNL